MAEDPRAETKREEAVVAAAALLVVYAAARSEIMGRVAHGVRSGLLLDHWMPRVQAINEAQAKRIAAKVARSISDTVSVERMAHWIEQGALERAEGWAEQFAKTLDELDALSAEFAREVQAMADAMVLRAPDDAADLTDAAVEFGAIEAEKANGKTTKTWHLGPNAEHRASHVALDGVTIGIDERFANGLRYPHAPGPPAETVNCNCFLTYGR